eukprot:1154012-Pelagomonas_calceolata.AAC.6
MEVAPKVRTRSLARKERKQGRPGSGWLLSEFARWSGPGGLRRAADQLQSLAAHNGKCVRVSVYVHA